jgi:hypothetical protein
MRSFVLAVTLVFVGCAPAVTLAKEFEVKAVEQFEENCSAVEMTMIMRTPGGASANLTLKKGETSPFLPLKSFFGTALMPLAKSHGEMIWHCGSTGERSECTSKATHVRVKRAATGREAKFTCYRVEVCQKGQTTLEVLDDRCREEMLRVGSARIKWLETEKDIPYSSAKLGDSGGVRWSCGGTPERSDCPEGTTLLTVERKDRDTGLFHIHCLRAGSQCEPHYGSYNR